MNLKKLAESFNYLSGIKNVSVLGEEIKLTSSQDEELLNIIKKYVKDPDDANNKIQDYIDGDVNQPDIQDGDFIDEFEAWKKKHNIKEGTCGYSVDGKPADTPAGPNLIKKSDLNESVRKVVRKVLKQVVKEGNYFNNLEEVSKLINNKNIENAYEYLKNMNKDDISINYFNKKVFTIINQNL